MGILQKLRELANRNGFEICRIGAERLGRSLGVDIQALIPEGPIFDVGANDGRAARTFDQLLPGRDLWLFEPARDMFERLVTSADLSRARPFNIALGAFEGEATLQKFEGSELNSLLKRSTEATLHIDEFSITEKGWESIRVRTLAAFCREYSVEFIALLKIDAQGYDLEVLKGAADFLSAGRIGLIQVEVNFVPLYEGQPSFSDLLAYLEGYQYRFVGFYDPCRDEAGALKWADALFIPRRPNSPNGD